MYAMNMFRVIGDILHLFSFVVLIHKMRRQRSCAGISLKTQMLYLIVFVCRYLDLPWNLYYISWFHAYLAAMKIIFIGATATVIYYIYTKYRATYNKEEDSFPFHWLLPPCFLLALVINQDFAFFEVMWTFSIYLEALTILPQLSLLQSTGNVETLTSHYVVCLGGYRFFYLINWIYRYIYEDDYTQWIVWVSGLIQTVLYADFFYYYFKSQIKGESMNLPTTNV